MTNPERRAQAISALQALLNLSAEAPAPRRVHEQATAAAQHLAALLGELLPDAPPADAAAHSEPHGHAAP